MVLAYAPQPVASGPNAPPAVEEFGARARARRQELGKSQEQLAEASGLHWTFVGQVERGRRNLSLANILKLAAGLQMDPEDLVRRLRPERF